MDLGTGCSLSTEHKAVVRQKGWDRAMRWGSGDLWSPSASEVRRQEVLEVKSGNQGKHWGTSNTSTAEAAKRASEAILGPHQVRTAMVPPAYTVGTSLLAVPGTDRQVAIQSSAAART
jgi:hypothetical protein